jgi:mRNA interferase MazF
LTPGDIVIAAFPGVHVTKARPAVVLSTAQYHSDHPDVILGLITTKPLDRPTPTDHEIRDWQMAGLHAPSWFRLYLVTLLQRDVRIVGKLTQRRKLGIALRAGRQAISTNSIRFNCPHAA